MMVLGLSMQQFVKHTATAWRQKVKLCVIRRDGSFWQPSQSAHLPGNMWLAVVRRCWWKSSPAGSRLTDGLLFPSPCGPCEASDLVKIETQITFFHLIGRRSQRFGSRTGGGCSGASLLQKHDQWRQPKRQRTCVCGFSKDRYLGQSREGRKSVFTELTLMLLTCVLLLFFFL